MKSILFLLILILELYSDDGYELKLYQSLFPALFQKERLIVYSQEAEQITIFKNSTYIKLSNNCSDADFIIGKDFDNLPNICDNKPIFATSYRSFTETQNAFGTFYWSKGRPQIQFKSESIKKFHLKLPENLQRYSK